MGWDVKLSKISNYIIAFVSCPVGGRNYAPKLEIHHMEALKRALGQSLCFITIEQEINLY